MAAFSLGGNAANAPWQGSFNASYQAANAGDTITVPAGTYGGQVIGSKGSARNGTCSVVDTAKCVAFVMGGQVKINGSLEIHGSGILIDGGNRLDVTGYVDTEQTSPADWPDHVVVENLHATSFGVFNVDTATFQNLDIGPAYVGVGSGPYSCGVQQGPAIENKIGFAGSGSFVPRNILLDGLHVHDQTSVNRVARETADCHFGGLFLVTADGLTIRNSVFERNVIYNIQIQNFGGAPAARNVLIEGNSFACGTTWAYAGGGCEQDAIQFDYDPGTQFTVRNNNSSAGANGLFGCYVGSCGGLAGLKTSGNVDYPLSPNAPPLPGGSPTPPPPPPPSCDAPALAKTIATRDTQTVAWTQVTNATGYRLYKNGVLVSTAGPAATAAKFGALAYGTTQLGVAAVCPSGEKRSTLPSTLARQ